jgi:Zn-dependent metalloprotease
MHSCARHPLHCILPDYVLRNIAERGSDQDRHDALEALGVSATLRSARVQAEGRGHTASPGRALALAAAQPTPDRIIRDGRGSFDIHGPVVRSEDGPESADTAVEQAFERLGETWRFFWEIYARNSIDQQGMPLEAVVHYGRRFDNAQWNGSQMLFGDGGRVFTQLTGSLSVAAHELGHGVIQFDGPLVYQGQSGALNESIADAFGAMVDQFVAQQTPRAADWLIGREILRQDVSGTALRSMRSPGTAYADDVLGDDIQPDHMDRYVETIDDFGGVHINSGIPNRAFVLFAEALDPRPSWEVAGRVWYATLGHPRLLPTCDFRRFARLTRYVATTMYGSASAEVGALEGAWDAVGVAL